MDTLRTNELSTSLLRKDENGSFTFRVVEREDEDGVLHREFCIVESAYCSTTGRWVSPRRQQQFVPLSLWPALVAHGQMIINLHGLGCEPVPLESVAKITDSIRSGNSTSGEQQEQRPKRQNYVYDNPLRTELSKLDARPRGRPRKSVTKKPRRLRPTKQTAASTESAAVPGIRAAADVEAKQFPKKGTMQCDNANINACVAASVAVDSSVLMSVEQDVAK